MNVYLDESGDLGWTLEKPYRKGGSSRYLTIAFLLVPSNLAHFPKRVVKKLYSRFKKPTTKEQKGWELKPNQKRYFVNKVVKLLGEHPEIEILAITVKKENVQQHIRDDPNKLYNYMISLILLDKIQHEPVVNFIRDRRSIKVESGNSLVDYLSIKLWFEHNSNTIIHDHPLESKKVANLQFIDYISNIVWNKYEDSDTSAFNILTGKIRSIELFF